VRSGGGGKRRGVKLLAEMVRRERRDVEKYL
jgi:hypothetical protein